MGRQHDNIRHVFGSDVRVVTVVGFKMDSIVKRFPESVFVYTEAVDQTNTSKSLLKGLRAHGDGGVLWMNGDVVFDPQILMRVRPLIAADDEYFEAGMEWAIGQGARFWPVDVSDLTAVEVDVPDDLVRANLEFPATPLREPLELIA